MYYGYWKDGQRHGEGVMTYKNEDIYSGNWANGKKDGKGTYIFKETGEKYVGMFKNGNLVAFSLLLLGVGNMAPPSTDLS